MVAHGFQILEYQIVYVWDVANWFRMYSYKHALFGIMILALYKVSQHPIAS